MYIYIYVYSTYNAYIYVYVYIVVNIYIYITIIYVYIYIQLINYIYNQLEERQRFSFSLVIHGDSVYLTNALPCKRSDSLLRWIPGFAVLKWTTIQRPSGGFVMTCSFTKMIKMLSRSWKIMKDVRPPQMSPSFSIDIAKCSQKRNFSEAE